jgi:hypothetical protein
MQRLLWDDFQKLEMLKIPDDADNIVARSLILNGKRLRKLSGDVLYAGVALTSLPNIRGRNVQLVDESVLPIEHDCFFFNHSAIDVCPTSWITHSRCLPSKSYSSYFAM